ncbi:MAG TPA: AAA family ATPase [Candidatus Anaerobiospirillum stercoravium]|nr:AAA family ATPase [Candidatus Anaerobiospirillum stercoravium]
MAEQSTPLPVQQHPHQTKNGSAQLPRITIGTHDFPSIRREGTLLVDKTAKIADLVKTNKVFLVRPHSFGKSMLISMLEELFAHGTEKFEGLAIHDTWPKTQCYPVISLSLRVSPDPQFFEQQLCEQLISALAQAGFPELAQRAKGTTNLSTLLWDKIGVPLCAHETVWLIEDWDSALLHNLDSPAAFEANYRVINTLLDGLNRLSNLRFLLVTGVGSYRAASLFPASDFTNISQHPYFADLLGYTQAEVETNFAPYIARACEVLGLSRDELLAQLKYHYGGFCFDHNAAVALYNPLAINNFFQQLRRPDNPDKPAFYPFWMANHNASAALSSCLKSRPVDLSFLAQATSNELRITQEQYASPAGCDQVDLKSLMLQTGLLTFKSVVNPKCHNLHERTYRCGFPNWEVESCCVSTFLKFLTTASSREWSHLPLKLKSAFQSWDLEQAVETLNTSLSWVPEAVWSQSSELTYRAFIYSVLIYSNLTPLRSEPDHHKLGNHEPANQDTSAAPLELVFDHKLLLLVPKLLPAYASQQDCLALAQQAQEQIVARAAQGFDPNLALWPKPPFKEHKGLVLVISDDSHQIVYWRLLSWDQAPEQVPEQASEPVSVLAEGWDSPQLNSKTIEAILVCAQPQEDQTTDEAELIIDSNALVKGFTKLARQLLAPSVSMSADAIKDMVRALVDGAQNLSASSLRSVDRDVLVSYLVAYLEVLLSSR